jgi:hypothetical protein
VEAAKKLNIMDPLVAFPHKCRKMIKLTTTTRPTIQPMSTGKSASNPLRPEIAAPSIPIA